VGLNPKQQEDLNFAILEYLQKQKFEQSAQAFAQEASVDFQGYLKTSTTPPSLLKDVLERKWTSIARLKKQVMDLERNCKQLKESNDQFQGDIAALQKALANGGGAELAHLTSNKSGKGDDDGSSQLKASGDAIPREPEKLKMTGHRSKVTKVIFHPKFNQVASSSEDGSIKLWDYETGECEQSLREHTGMVNYINFHPTGNFLASCSKDMTIKLWRLTSD